MASVLFVFCPIRHEVARDPCGFAGLIALYVRVVRPRPKAVSWQVSIRMWADSNNVSGMGFSIQSVREQVRKYSDFPGWLDHGG